MEPTGRGHGGGHDHDHGHGHDHGDEDANRTAVMWINPLDLLPGDASVTTTHEAVSSGVGGGLAGLVVHSSTTGENAQSGGNKVVWMGIQVPPGWTVTGVRTCYELTSKGSYISQVRLAQLQDPPSSAVVMLDDGTNQTNPGPVCLDSQATSVDPAAGAIFLSYRVNFSDTADRIVIRGVGLHLASA